MDYLNDAEKASVQYFYESPIMREAVKKVILDHIYGCGILQPGKEADPLHNRAIVLVQQAKAQGKTDEQIGHTIAVFAEAVALLESSFNDMANVKKVEPQEPKKNRAR